MLQILYLIAFTTLSIFAVISLIRSMVSLSQSEVKSKRYNMDRPRAVVSSAIHPELLDENGNLIDEPLLVMRSVSFDDARSRLDALYESSPGSDL